MSFEPAAPVPARSRSRGAFLLLAGGYANLALLVVQGLLLVPLYLRFIGAEMYGAWLATGDVLGWLSVLDLGVAGVITQRMAAGHGRGDTEAVSRYFGTGMLVQGGMVALLLALAFALAPFLPGWMGVDGGDAEVLSGAFRLAAGATALGILATGAAALPLALQRVGIYNLATLASAVAGIGVTLWLVLDGRGLWALALGLAARSGLLLAIMAGYALFLLHSEVRRRIVWSWSAAREMGALAGPTFLAMIGNAVMGRSDALLIALLVRPEVATLYVLTRRAAEIIAMFLARIGGAVFPGFAHLVGSGNEARARDVLEEVRSAYMAVGSFAVALYLALNRTFVSLWVGSEQYGGLLLTLLIALSTLLVGHAALLTYLLGASGAIARGAYLIFGEAVVRLALIVVLVLGWGVAGVPAAAVATSAVAGWLAVRWLSRRLGGSAPVRLTAVPAVVVAAGALAGGYRWAADWLGFAAWGALFAFVAAALLLGLDPTTRRLARRVGSGAARRLAGRSA